MENQSNRTPKLSIKLRDRHPGGWLLALGGYKEVKINDNVLFLCITAFTNQILASSIDFWKLHDQGNNIEHMTQNEMYPPRFKLVISGKEATKSAIAEIDFIGSQEDLDTEILLELDGML